jgi:hypothetical protein
MAKPEKTKAEVEAEAKIFGAAEEGTEKADIVGVVNAEKSTATPAPKAETKKRGSDGDSITLSREQFEQLMGRLGDLETVAMQSQRSGQEDIFNPLAVVTKDRTANVAFHGNELVVGYEEKKKPDGKVTYTWLQKDEKSGEIRTFVTLLLKDLDTEKTRKETVDYVHFLEAATPVKATIKSSRDIGGVVEQGMVNRMVWNGKTMVATNERVMTGARIQKFILTCLVNNKLVELPENVVNIK